MKRKLFRVVFVAFFASFMAISAAQGADFTFHGASQFDEEHAFTRLMRKFEELVQLYYTGDKSIEFVMHLNSELGLEKDYVAYMNQGISVDYAVASPSHMSTFSKMASLMDPPMLYQNHIHWSKVLGGNALQPIVDDILAKADIRIIGYGGGGTRMLIVNKPVQTMEDIKECRSASWVPRSRPRCSLLLAWLRRLSPMPRFTTPFRPVLSMRPRMRLPVSSR
jgi:TRAP-type C4-dicarboxylate transport system substrate-binding protein